MRTPTRHAILAFAALAALAAVTARAQQRNTLPRLGYVSPAGGRQGASLMLLVGGQTLDGATTASLSGDGINARIVECFRPIRQGQVNSVRDRLKQVLDRKRAAQTAAKAASAARPAKARWTADDDMLVDALRKKLAAALRGPAVPALAEGVLVQVAIAGDATPGRRALRVATPRGWSNPLAFFVGTLDEYSKEPAGAAIDPAFAKAPKPRYRDEPVIPPPDPPMDVALPCVVNGQIGPGGADLYRFEARAGQRLVIAAGTRRLIPYISDAVPGWFQAALTLRDEAGRELAYADHRLFDPEPVLLYEVPNDGRYVVEIRDALYRGREDFVYRTTMGEVPFVTSIFPLGGRAGERTTVELAGWNLPASTLNLDHAKDPPGIHPFTVSRNGVASNAVPFALDDLPERIEQEPNDGPGTAQAIVPPLIVNGRIGKTDDPDLFRFDGRAGEETVAEIHARRLGSPLDSVLTFTDAAGRRIAHNDDHEDKASGLNTHHSDSCLRVTLPTSGTYLLHLGDAQHKGGPDHAYRLRIGPPRPDFELRIAPSSIVARAGAAVSLTVFALRKDGFAGPIDLRLHGASEGLTLEGGPIPAGADQASLMLKVVYWTGPTDVARVNIEGHATIGPKEISHPAMPAENMTQAFEYRHLVAADDLKMTVTGRLAPRLSIKILGAMPVRIPTGQSALVKFGVSPAHYLAKARFELNKPPQGIALEKAAPASDGMEIVLRCDADKARPGLRGRLALVAVTEPRAQPGVATPPTAANRSRPPITPPPVRFPSIPFEIVRP